MARPRASSGPDSRSRLLTAATREFAEQGFAGASVDRIARAARLNKAMLYYHFASKHALYRAIIRTILEPLGQRAEIIAASDAPPPHKLQAFVAAFTEEAARRHEFARMMLRELTEQARHLDARTARVWMSVPAAFLAILSEGQARGEFRPVHPLLAYLAVIGPVVLALASGPTRTRLERLSGRPLPGLDPERLRDQAQTLAAALLQPAGRATPHPKGDLDESPLARPRVRRRPAAPRRRLS